MKIKSEPKNEVIKGFKGFDKDFKCKDFQFEVGKEFEEKGQIEICAKGFHFCTNPFDVLAYYPVGTNRYGQVETNNKTQNHPDDSKIVTNKLKINAEIGLKGLIKAGIEWIFEQTKISKKTIATSGYGANAATSGDEANAATSGDRANAATSGDRANAATSGNNTISAAIGISSCAKANKGSWIVLSEWIEKDDKLIIKSVKTAKIDGKKLLSNIYYKLIDGKFTKAE